MGAEGPTLWEGDGAGIAGKRTLGQWRVPDPRRGHFKGLLWQPFGGTRERCQDLGKRWSGGQGSSSPDPAQAVAFVRQLRRSQLPEPHFPQSPLLDVGKHLFSAGKDSESLLASFRDLPPHPASAHSSRLPGPGRQVTETQPTALTPRGHHTLSSGSHGHRKVPPQPRMQTLPGTQSRPHAAELYLQTRTVPDPCIFNQSGCRPLPL